MRDVVVDEPSLQIQFFAVGVGSGLSAVWLFLLPGRLVPMLRHRLPATSSP